MKQTLSIRVTHPLNVLTAGVPYAFRPYWGDAASRTLEMDLLLPKQRAGLEPLPVLLFFCGGAFRGMDRSIWLPALTYYADRGYAVASADYRTGPDGVYPACVEDVCDAVRFLMNNAERFNIDPDRIAVAGESAGGFLACRAGMDVPGVRAIVDYYGVVDLTMPGDSEDCNNAVTDEFMRTRDADALREASPIARITKDTPPVLILHGDRDPLVPFASSEAFYQKLNEAGVPAEFLALDGEGHGTDAFYQEEVHARVLDFLNRALPAQR